MSLKAIVQVHNSVASLLVHKILVLFRHSTAVYRCVHCSYLQASLH